MTFEHDGIRFNYRVTGEGPVVVFTHGLTGDLNQPLELLGPLPGYKLVVWDCRGHGLTEPFGPAERFNFETFAADLRALLNKLNIHAAVLGGISMGAAVAARFCVEWPQSVKGLVLVRPAWLTEPNPRSLYPWAVLAEILAEFGQDGLPHLQKHAAFQHLLEQSKDNANALCQQFAKPGAVERCARISRMLTSAPISEWKQTAGLGMPALVVGNQRDPMHPFEFAQQWAEHLPNAELLEIPDKNEDARPHREAFRAALRRFLELHAC